MTAFASKRLGDPFPFRNRFDGTRWPDNGGDPWLLPHKPRAEFGNPDQSNEPNPILLGFRRSEGTRDEILAFAGWLANDLDPDETDHRGTPAQIEHAKRVLSRLAATRERL